MLVPSVPLCCCSLGVLLPAGWPVCELHRAAAPLLRHCWGAAAEQGLPAGSPPARSFGSKEWSFSPKDKYGLCSFCGSSALGPRFVSPSRLVLQQPGWRQKHQERCLLLTGGLVGCFNIFFFLTETVGSEKSSSSKALLPLQSTVGLIAWDKNISPVTKPLRHPSLQLCREVLGR